jgi:hypothetical protein
LTQTQQGSSWRANQYSRGAIHQDSSIGTRTNNGKAARDNSTRSPISSPMGSPVGSRFQAQPNSNRNEPPRGQHRDSSRFTTQPGMQPRTQTDQVTPPEPVRNSWRDASRSAARNSHASDPTASHRQEAPPRETQSRERKFENRAQQNHGFDQRSNNRSQVFGPPQPARSQPTQTQPPPQSNGDRQHQGRAENRAEGRAQGNRERGRGDRM